MSKKHYEAVAAVLADYTQGQGWSFETSSAIASDLATVFAQDNARFDRERFLAACGGAA